MAGEGAEEANPAPQAADPAPQVPESLPEATVRREIEQVIESYVPLEARGEVVEQVMMVTAENYRGALPHPRHFQAFNEVLPGCAERIMRMTEREQEHRHARENRIIGAETGYASRAQYMATGIMILLVIGAAYSIHAGSVGGAVAFLGMAAVSVVIAFLRGQINWFGGQSESKDGGTEG